MGAEAIIGNIADIFDKIFGLGEVEEPLEKKGGREI